MLRRTQCLLPVTYSKHDFTNKGRLVSEVQTHSPVKLRALLQVGYILSCTAVAAVMARVGRRADRLALLLFFSFFFAHLSVILGMYLRLSAFLVFRPVCKVFSEPEEKTSSKISRDQRQVLAAVPPSAKSRYILASLDAQTLWRVFVSA
jgi:sulfite exporter TauE/SafE